MAERVETVRLLMNISNYLAGMEQARLATAKLSVDSTARLAQQRAAFTQAGIAIAGIGVVAAAAVAVSVAKFAEFDQAMSNVKAVTQESTSNMGLLRAAALEAGASTIFTATEAANGIEELGKAGLSTADILGGGLKQALALAASGQLGIARASEITATTLKQFNFSGKEAGRVADTLSAGAGKALGSVEDLAQALKFVGPVANSMGISLEETTGTLALFASQGIIGEQAGTGLRGMLSSLTSPSKLARDEISKLGITLYDSNGKFLGLENAAGELQGAFKGLTDEQRDFALGQIFGNAQVTEARILYQAGAKGVADWTAAVTDSGYAAKVANDRLDNLKGDIEKLGGAFETFAINQGSGANGVLRNVVQNLTSLLDIAGQLPQPMLDAGLAVGTVVAGVAGVTGATLTAIPKIGDLKDAMANLNITGRSLAGGIGLASVATLGAVAAFALYANKALEVQQTNKEIKSSLNQVSGAMTDYTRDTLAAKIQSTGAAEAGANLGLSLETLVDAASGVPTAIQKVSDAFEKSSYAGNDTVAVVDQVATGFGRIGTSQLYNYLSNLNGTINTSAKELREVAAATGDNEAALATLTGAAEDADGKISGLADTIRKFGSAQLDVNSASRALEASVDAATDALARNSQTLDIGTAEGRENQAALDDIAKSTLELAAATVEQTGHQEDANAVIEAGRQRLLDTAAQFGVNGQAAVDYADRLGLIPKNIDSAVGLNTSGAKQELDSFAAYAASRLNLVAYIRTVDGRADGGPIFGVGGPRQDNIPIMASVGEHMLDAEDVRRMGGHGGVYAFRRSLYLADGGPVTYVPASPQYVLAASAATAGEGYGGSSAASGGVVTLDGPVDFSDRTIDKLARATAGYSRNQRQKGGL